MSTKEEFTAFQGQLSAYEIVAEGRYLMTTSRREGYIFPAGTNCYDTAEGILYQGDGATTGGVALGSGGEGGYLGITNPGSGVLVSDADLATIKAAGDGAFITNEILEESFVLGFKYSRLGFDGSYSGGNAYIPYTAFTEDGSTLNAGHGVRGTVPSRMTAVTAQFDTMAGDADLYYQINEGAGVLLGVIDDTVGFNTFSSLDIAIPASSQIRFYFNSSGSGSFTEPTVTAFVRQPLAP